MHQLATIYRAAQFFAHNAHNLVEGATFFEDHEYLGELYGTYESAYDSIVERMIGLGKKVDLDKITTEAAQLSADTKADSSNGFSGAMHFEVSFCQEIDDLLKTNTSQGTKNFLQGLADESEARQYKLGQRLGK